MNHKIIEQLKKCKTTLPNYCNSDLELIIPKLADPVVTQSSTCKEDFFIGYKYVVRVNKSLIYPCDWYYTIHSNWNQGIGPKDEILYITVIQKMGKMMKVSSIGYNTKQPWTGWLPQTNVTILT